MKTITSQRSVATKEAVLADIREVLERQGEFNPAAGACTVGRLVVIHSYLAWPIGEASRNRQRLLIAELHGLPTEAIPDPGPPDLQILIRPLGPASEVPAAVLDAERRARSKYLSSTDPNVVAHAAHRIAQLDIPVIRRSDLAELLLRLTISAVNSPVFHIDLQTDTSGVARMSQFPISALCCAELVDLAPLAGRSEQSSVGIERSSGTLVPDATMQKPRHRGLFTYRPSRRTSTSEGGGTSPRASSLPTERDEPSLCEDLSTVSFSAASEASPDAGVEPLIYFPDDRRIVATVGPAGEEACTLLLETTDPKLAGTLVHCRIGNWTKTLRLNYDSDLQTSLASTEVLIAFRLVSEHEPQFEIELPEAGGT